MVSRNPGELKSSRNRWSAWFEGRLDRGPVIYAEAPRDPLRSGLPLLSDPGSVEGRWTDLEHRLASLGQRMDGTWSGGDAVPSWFPNLGPGVVAACTGPWPTFTEDSVWFNELPDNSLEAILGHLRFDPGNRYWRLIQELSARAVARADGDWIVSLTDLGGDLDILASLRGGEKLLVDLLESPELVMACRTAIGQLWLECFREQNRLLASAGQEGYSAWIPAWYAKPWSVLQCDLSVMFSSRLFEEFVLPELIEKSEAMARSIYHLDGPGEWRHLDSILSVPGISAIQYVSVPGDPPNEDPSWLPYYRKIAEAGKGVFIFAKDPIRLRELARGMPAERLACHVAFDSIGEAGEFMEAFATGV